jgi:EamA-like transporter family.
VERAAHRGPGLVGAGADGRGRGLLYLLIQRGAAVQVTSLIYWVPPVTALMGWALFHETLGPTTWVGMALVAPASSP